MDWILAIIIIIGFFIIAHSIEEIRDKVDNIENTLDDMSGQNINVDDDIV